jgi:RNA polymerase sigma-70 factor (ECF subfamily)
LDDIDRPIIEDVRAGNVRRFAELVDRHKDRALTLACRLLGNREEAEEAVQDAFLRCFRALERFRGESRFSTWFYRILYNRCLTQLHRRGEAEEEAEPVDQEVLQSVAAEVEETSALRLLEEREMADILQEETDRLPSQYRSALLLFYVQEMRYEEISEVLALPMGTVKTHLFRAREMLKKRVLTRIEEAQSA